MKIYSLFKILSFCGITIFFINFIICFLFLAEFYVMFWLTMPFIVITLAAYSSVCLIDEFFAEIKISEHSKRKVLYMEDYKRNKKERLLDNNNFDEFEKSTAC